MNKEMANSMRYFGFIYHTNGIKHGYGHDDTGEVYLKVQWNLDIQQAFNLTKQDIYEFDGFVLTCT